MRMPIALAALLAIATSPAEAAPNAASSPTPDPVLSRVDPELRGIAAAILSAPAPATPKPSPDSPRRPLPEGVDARMIPADRQRPAIDVFVVNSRLDTPARGAVLFIHGGGFVSGDARDDLRRLVGLARRLDCVIVSVQYRLAPATRFPGALEDDYAALSWLHAKAGSLGVDPARIVVMGESAGGGHAAMLAIAARDRHGPPIAGLMLVYPMLDDRTGSTIRVPRSIGRLVWRPEANRQGWTALLGRPAGAAAVPYGSVPARVPDLAGLPPTFIGVGGIDLFVDEDVEFARRLIAAEVPTELTVVPGAFHGFQLIVPQAAVSKRFEAAIETALARMLRGTGS